jgi:DNA-binding CsgD family transcriptional regulator/Tfp pilus assembly protein PilF
MIRLVNLSLVTIDVRGPAHRYRLLEPVRQYAEAHLMATDELAALGRQHATFFLAFAEGWEPASRNGGPQRRVAHDALELELDNLRAAMRWCAQHDEPLVGLRLANALALLWVWRSDFGEGLAWLCQFLTLSKVFGGTPTRAMALAWAAQFAARRGDRVLARSLQEEGLAAARATGDQYIIHNMLQSAALDALYRADYAAAKALLDEALAVDRATLDDPNARLCEAKILTYIGELACLQGNYAAARLPCEEALRIDRGAEDAVDTAITIANLGQALVQLGDLRRARGLFEEGIGLTRGVGYRAPLALCLAGLAGCAAAEGHLDEALARFKDSLRIQADLGEAFGAAASLEAIAAIAARRAQPERAVRLAGAAAAFRSAVEAPLSPMHRAILERWFVPLQQNLGEANVAENWAFGRALSFDGAVALALDDAGLDGNRSQAQAIEPRPARGGLTLREQEVAELVARGFTNRQIAHELVVSERTVEWHVAHILGKLGMRTRSGVAAWMARHT